MLGRQRTAGAGETFTGRSPQGQVVTVTVVRPEAAAAPEFRERLRADVAAARTVSGNSIMPIVDADPDAPSPWLATTAVPGLPLRQAVDRYGPLPEQALRRLATDLAEALSRIHAAGLIHGGIGPDSVLLATDGPCVAAFGIGATDEADRSRMNDMFDLGATVLFAASGHEPAREGGFEDVRTRIAAPETVTGLLPWSLREVIAGCLYPDPSTRPTAEQLVDYLNHQGLAAPAGSWLPPALTADITAATAASALPPGTGGSGIRRRKLLLGLAAGAVLIGGAAAGTLLSAKGPSPASSGPAGGSTPSAPPPPAPTASRSSSDGPTPVALSGPDATKAWTVVGQSAPTFVEASDRLVMVVTPKSTAFLDASTGKSALPALNTTNSYAPRDTTPAVYAAGVFYYLCEAPDAPNTLAAVDDTGKVKWATTMAMTDPGDGTDTQTYYLARQVAVNGNTVYVCGNADAHSSSTEDPPPTGYIRAFDGATGKGLWRVAGTDINNVLVPPSGRHLLAASSTPTGKAGQVEMIDAGQQGARGWKTPIAEARYYFESGWPLTCYGAGMFFFAGETGDTLLAVDAATGAEKWRQKFDSTSGDHVQLGAPFASPDGATVYVPLGGVLVALASADGTARWAAELTGAGEFGVANAFEASLRVSGPSARCTADTVFVTDTAKTLWAIDSATGKARWRYSDPGQPDIGFNWTVGGDYVFVASNLTLTALSIHGQ